MLVQLDIAVGHAVHVFVRHFRHLLAFLAHEVVVDEPLAYEFLGKLLLGFAFFKLFLVPVCVEVTAGVGRMDFVDEIDFTVFLAELILGIHQYQSLFRSHFRAAGEEGVSIFFHQFVVFLAHESLGDDFFLRYVFIVSGIGFRGRSDDRGGELLVFFHAFGQLHAAEFAATVLILTPCGAGQIPTDNHFHAEAFAFQSHGHHRVRSGQLPVGYDVARGIEESGCNLVQHLPFEGDSFGQDHIECRNTVGGHHDHQFVVDVIHVAYFSVIYAFLSREVKISVS